MFLRKFYSVVLILLFSCNNRSPNKESTVINNDSPNPKNYLATAELNGKTGCIDSLGNEIVPVKYDDIGFWGDNLIAVNVGAKKVDYSKEGGKWGYCNAEGKLVIPIQFDKAETFKEGLAAVRVKDKWGFIDTSGNIVIQPKYEETRIFREGLCPVSLNGRWGYVDRAGQEVIAFQFGQAGEFQQGLASVFIGKKENEMEKVSGKYCLIDKRGNRKTEPKYQMIWDFHEGLARVEVEDSLDKYGTKEGFIDTNGKEVIPPIYDDVEDFSEGLAAVGVKVKENEILNPEYSYGYINTKGIQVINPQYSRADRFDKGKAVVGKGKHRSIFAYKINLEDNSIINHDELPSYALIDQQGKYLFGFDWGGLSQLENDLFIAQRKRYSGDGVINLKGEVLVPFKYTNLTSLGGNLFVADNGGGRDSEYTVIDINNDTVIRDTKYLMPGAKYEFGVLNARINNMTKSVLLDAKGNIKSKQEYDMIFDFQPTDN